MGKVAEMAQEQRLEPAKPKDAIEDILRKNWPRIASVLPKHMSADRLLSLSISTLNKTPKLAECTPASLLSCFMQCSSLGLEPSDVDGLGRAYILPYGNTATFILGYRGMIDLARRSGEIKTIFSEAVYEGEKFSRWTDETGQHFRHDQANDIDKKGKDLLGAYVSTEFTNGGRHFMYMSRAEIESIRKRSKTANNGPWVTDYEEMAKKTVVRRASKYWPLSAEVAKAIASDETDGGYVQTIEPIIEIEPVEALPADPEPVQDPIPEPAPAVRSAVCKTCGNRNEGVPSDVTIADLNVFQCCDKPDYGWAE